MSHTHDSASAKFSTNSRETDYSVGLVIQYCLFPAFEHEQIERNISKGGRGGSPHLLVSAIGVDAAAVDTGVGPTLVTLVDVDVAVGAVEAGATVAAVAVANGGAGGAVATRLAGAVVRLLAVLSCTTGMLVIYVGRSVFFISMRIPIRIRIQGPNQCGFRRIRILIRLLRHKKLNFYMKNILKVDEKSKRSKNIPYEGTKTKLMY